jgi:hypothetical protein
MSDDISQPVLTPADGVGAILDDVGTVVVCIGLHRHRMTPELAEALAWAIERAVNEAAYLAVLDK